MSTRAATSARIEIKDKTEAHRCTAARGITSSGSHVTAGLRLHDVREYLKSREDLPQLNSAQVTRGLTADNEIRGDDAGCDRMGIVAVTQSITLSVVLHGHGAWPLEGSSPPVPFDIAAHRRSFESEIETALSFTFWTCLLQLEKCSQDAVYERSSG